MHQVIQSDSRGNAIIYNKIMMVDAGVSYKQVQPFEKDLQIVLLTHQHKDHFDIKMIKKMQDNRPTIRIGCCEWMLPLLSELNNIDVYQISKVYDYGVLKVSPVKLYHDVPNCGYRIFFDDYRIFHATDTAHLKGITAKDYDLYAIEHNYDEEKAEQTIEKAKQENEYCYLTESIKTHLSDRQAWDFIRENKNNKSKVIKLHQSKKYS